MKWAIRAWELTLFLVASFCIHRAVDLGTHDGWPFAGLLIAGAGGALMGFDFSRSNSEVWNPDYEKKKP